MPNVPTSVKVLAIIGIVLGCLGILGVMFSALMLFVTIGPPNPLMESLRHDSVYLGITAVGLAIGLPLTGLLIVASIQSLRLVPWARRDLAAIRRAGCRWCRPGRRVAGRAAAAPMPALDPCLRCAPAAPPGFLG